MLAIYYTAQMMVPGFLRDREYVHYIAYTYMYL